MKHFDSLTQRRERDQTLLDTGMDAGFQKAVDFFSIVLNDPEIMGKDTFGENRLMKVAKAVSEVEYHFRNAYNTEVDSDYLQEEMDGVLKEIYKNNFSPFAERYPYIRMATYEKSKKGWK